MCVRTGGKTQTFTLCHTLWRTDGFCPSVNMHAQRRYFAERNCKKSVMASRWRWSVTRVPPPFYPTNTTLCAFFLPSDSLVSVNKMIAQCHLGTNTKFRKDTSNHTMRLVVG